jgi:hypothetical protein
MVMQTTIVLLLVLATSSAPAPEKVPSALVSKDSLVFEFSVRDVQALWERNARPKGTIEHEWVFDIPLRQPATWPFNVEGLTHVHFGVTQESAGPPVIRGDLSGLIENSTFRFWATSNQEDVVPVPRRLATGAKPGYSDGTVRLVVRWRFPVEFMTRLRPAEMTLRGVRADGSAYEEAVVVNNVRDPREALARTIVGPFSPDEYAIYQAVIDRAFHNAMIHDPDLKSSLLNPSVDAGLFSDMDSNVQALGAADDTLADYLKKRSTVSDLVSLTALGYDVVESEAFQTERKSATAAERRCSVRVSRIGFNAAGDQALLYCDHSCGGLSGEGEAILLDRVDGEWRVTRRVGLWIA